MTVWRCLNCGESHDADARPAWCSGCGDAGTTVRAGRRRAARIDAEVEVASAADLARAHHQVEPLRPTRALVGRGALVVLVGPPGSRKSTLALQICAAASGPALVASAEEGPGPAVAARLARVGATRRDLWIAGWSSCDQVVELVRQRRVETLVVDSVQASQWHARELRHVLAICPQLRTLIAVSQVNSQGSIHGGMALEHEADVVIEMAAGKGFLKKSRFEEVTSENVVFPLFSAVAGGEIRPQGIAVDAMSSVRNEVFSAVTARGRGALLDLSVARAARGGGERPVESDVARDRAGAAGTARRDARGPGGGGGDERGDARGPGGEV
jgi:hypothetical protein